MGHSLILVHDTMCALNFVIAIFTVISACDCSDMFSHIHTGTAIIGRLKAIFILVLKNLFLINLSHVLQVFYFFHSAVSDTSIRDTEC